MFVRNVKDQTMMIGGQRWKDQAAKPNLYPNAFPFDRGNLGLPSAAPLVALHGMNSAVSTAADLWPQGGLRTFPTAAFTIGVSSSSALDINTTGTGAWIVEVDALDINYIPYTIRIALNGQTKVVDATLGATAFRINDVRVYSLGTGAANAGDIYVYDSSDTVTAGVPQTATKIFHKITATENIGRGGFYTVPAGCRLQTQQIRGGFSDIITTARAGVLNLWFYKYRSGGVPVQSYFPITGQITNGVAIEVSSPDFAPIFDEKWDLTMHVSASTGSTMVGYVDACLYYK